MPIANCFIKDRVLTQEQQENILAEWSTAIQVDSKNITFNILHNFTQIGNTYTAMVYLFIPSLWSEENTKKMQLALHHVLTKNLKIETHQVFILTSIIESGHVVENGETQEW